MVRLGRGGDNGVRHAGGGLGLGHGLRRLGRGTGLGLGHGGRGRGGLGVGDILVGVDAALDGAGDAGGELVGNVGQSLRDLGGESVGEVGRGVVLLVKRLLDLAAGAGRDELVLLVDDLGDHGVDLVGQVLDGGSQGQGVRGAELGAGVDLLDSIVDGADERVRGVLDGGRVAAAEVGDGRVERRDLAGDGVDDFRGGRLALGGGSQGSSGGQSHGEEAGELHDDGDGGECKSD